MRTTAACLFFVLAFSALAAPLPKKTPLDDAAKLRRFEETFTVEVGDPSLQPRRRAMALALRQKAVPTLVKVMKSSQYPDKNRWHATMLLGQIMGKKSAPFIARFAEHPSWMMRVASLKALAALDMRQYHAVYGRALKDSSLIVRVQALDNISRMEIAPLAPHVWAMMYDQTNYTGKIGARRRTSIVRSVIRTLGDLKYARAQVPMAKLIQKAKYQDLAEDLDYSLRMITGKQSPANVEGRRAFWAKTAMATSPAGKVQKF